MSDRSNDDSQNVEDVDDRQDVPLPAPSEHHAKLPERVDDDALEVVTQHERVAAGLADYAPSDVPDAADSAPTGTSAEVDQAQRGLRDQPGQADQD
jgi:hypothetical protein